MTLDQVIVVLTTLQSKMREAGAATDIPLLFYDDNRRDMAELTLGKRTADLLLGIPSRFCSETGIWIPLQLFDMEEER